MRLPLLAISGHGAHITQWVSLFYSEWLSLSPSFSCLLALTVFYLPFLAAEAAAGTREAGGGVKQVEDLS